MHRYKNLIIIGTSHISSESVREIEANIEREKPDVIALELDKGRLQALLEGGRGVNLGDIRSIGLKGWIFALIGHFAEEKLGEVAGMKPGSEMLKAYELAQKNSIRVALIDRDIRLTLKNLSKRISRKEKWRFFVDILKSPFERDKIKFDLKKVPGEEIIKKLLNELKERYPNIYDVLVTERNKHMAKNLYKLMQNYNIIAIVGAGHSEGLIKEVKCLEREN